MSDKSNSLLTTFQNLISKGKEGEYWDFKQEWHEKNEDLIKDILCFANTVHNNNCYLIFGVNDDLKIVGMTKTRRKQVEVIDTLSNLNFAGDNKPKISVETFKIFGIEIDILIILNSYSVPYYLKSDYGKMKQGCVYVRIGDKNTPNNGNADMPDIEMLWKKRLGLTNPPLEFIYERLHKQLEWKENNENYYNIYKPEYTISINNDEDDRNADEFYSYAMTNESTTFQTLSIKCHETILEGYEIVVLDSGRYVTPVPEWGFIAKDEYGVREKYAYKYFLKNSSRYILHNFLFDEDNHEQVIARNDLFEVVLLFEDLAEKESFEIFIKSNKPSVEQLINKAKDRYSYIDTGAELKTKVYKEKLQIGLAFNVLLKQFREIKG